MGSADTGRHIGMIEATTMVDGIAAGDEAATETPETIAVEVQWSAVLEMAASRMGLSVDRLGESLTVCSDGETRVAFCGIAGNRSGQAAHTLCQSDGWLRRYLASRGIPTMDGEVVGLNSPNHAYDIAERLGFPLVARRPHREASPEAVAHDMDAFRRLWRRLQASSRRVGRDQVIVERAVDTRHLIAVAGDWVEVIPIDEITAQGPAPNSDSATPRGDTAAVGRATDLAPRAVAVLPDLGYAMVRLAERADGGNLATVVDGIDPAFGRWWRPSDAVAERIAAEVLRLEFGAPSPQRNAHN